MRKIIIVGVAILLGMAMVSTVPAQVNPPAQGVLCDAGLGNAPLNLLQGSHTGTAAYNAPSSDPNVDVYTFCGAEGEEVDFFVDNVDTPSDLWACVIASPTGQCDPLFYNSFLFDLGGDDELPCSVPHVFACPAGIAPLPADSGDGTYYIIVGTWSSPGGYSGTVEVDGSPVAVLPTIL